jgi:putative Ig domain-containing protein
MSRRRILRCSLVACTRAAHSSSSGSISRHIASVLTPAGVLSVARRTRPKVTLLAAAVTGIASFLVLVAPSAGAQTVSTPTPSSGPAGTVFSISASGWNVPGVPPCIGPLAFSWDPNGSNQQLGSLPDANGTFTATAPNAPPQTYTIQAECPISATSPPAYLQAFTSFTLTAPTPPSATAPASAPTTTTTTTTQPTTTAPANPTVPTTTTQPPTPTTTTPDGPTTTTSSSAATTTPGGVAGDPAGGPITGCPGNLTGTSPNQTYTLSGPCATTAPLTIPPNITTLDGAGNTISASDTPSSLWPGGGIVEVPAGQTANITNLTVSGPAGGFSAAQCGPTLYGIFFNSSSGTVSGVTVEHIWQQQTNLASPACVTGTAIRAEGPGTLTITGTKVMDYQKNGIDGRNSTSRIMDVSGSTIGPPHNLQGFIAANGLVYVSGASGTATGNMIFGSGDQAGTGPDTPTDATAVLLFGAQNVTITHNTITSDPSTAGTDIGVSVTVDSTGIIISFNQVGRIAPDVPDPTGIGIAVCSSTSTEIVAVCGADAGISSATLICNTFSNWKLINGVPRNILGAIQIGCTPPPDPPCATPYTANLTVEGGVSPFTWSASGPLPPGLALSSSGVISGTATSAGTFTFTATVSDSSTPPLTASQDQTITVAAPCPVTTPSTPSTTVPAVPVATSPASTPPASTPPAAASAGPLAVTGLNETLPIVGLILVVLGLGCVGLSRRLARRS